MLHFFAKYCSNESSSQKTRPIQEGRDNRSIPEPNGDSQEEILAGKEDDHQTSIMDSNGHFEKAIHHDQRVRGKNSIKCSYEPG